jgi:hypothetical protein
MSDLTEAISDNIQLGKTVIFRKFGSNAIIEICPAGDLLEWGPYCQALPLDNHFVDSNIAAAIRLLALKTDGFE